MNAIFRLNLQLFAAGERATFNPNVSTQTSPKTMAPTMKDFYDTALLENARPVMVWDQFAKHQTITHGKRAEWRKFDTFAPATTPLVEAQPPTGKSFGMSTVTGDLAQYGDFTTVSDVLELAAFDDIIYGATEEMGSSMGETYNILTRDMLSLGNSVAFAPNLAGDTEKAVVARGGLDGTSRLTPKVVHAAATWLKKHRAPKINGYYVAVIHPSVAHDLIESNEWKEFQKYTTSDKIFKGEIGELYGVKFIEFDTAKVIKDGSNAVYLTMFFGKDAFGLIDLEGAGQEMIIHDKSEIGGPIDQYSTIGYKFMHGGAILYQERMLRVESNSSYSDVDEAN